MDGGYFASPEERENDKCLVCGQKGMIRGPDNQYNTLNSHGTEYRKEYYHECCIQSVLEGPEKYIDGYGEALLTKVLLIEKDLRDKRKKKLQREQDRLKVRQALLDKARTAAEIRRKDVAELSKVKSESKLLAEEEGVTSSSRYDIAQRE